MKIVFIFLVVLSFIGLIALMFANELKAKKLEKLQKKNAGTKTKKK